MNEVPQNNVGFLAVFSENRVEYDKIPREFLQQCTDISETFTLSGTKNGRLHFSFIWHNEIRQITYMYLCKLVKGVFLKTCHSQTFIFRGSERKIKVRAIMRSL